MENIYEQVKRIKKEIYNKTEFKDENNKYLKYMGLSGVDKNGNLRTLYLPPTDPSELTIDIGTYIWNIDPNVIPHLQEYESDEGLYRFKETNEQIPSLQFIPIKDLDQKTINDVQTYIDNAYSYVDKLFEYPYKLIHYRNLYKGYKLDYSKEIMDTAAKKSEEILDMDNEFKSNFKLNEINKIKLNRGVKKKKCNKIKESYNKLFDDDEKYEEINKDNYYTGIGLDYKQKQTLLKNKERRCDNIHKVFGRIHKNKKKNKILLQDLLINFKLEKNKSKQLLFGNQPFLGEYNNNKKIIIDPFVEQELELSFLTYNKMINKAVTSCINHYSDLLFPCRVLINLNLNHNYFDNKANSITNKEYIYIGFFLIRFNNDSDIDLDIEISDQCKKYYNLKNTYFPKSKEKYNIFFIYKKNNWNEFDDLKKKLLYYNYYVINYRCNFVNMGDITEYKRVLYTEIEQLICMNTQNNAYIYILLKINQKPNIININNQCNHILESNKSKKTNKHCIESNFHNSFINLLNLNNISYYSNNYNKLNNPSTPNTIYEQHILISKIEFNSMYCNLTKLLENQKQTSLNICRQFITNIRSVIKKNYNQEQFDKLITNEFFNKFMINELYNNHELYYILDNINDIRDFISYNLISKCIKKIDKYYNIYLELNNITITQESLKISNDETIDKGYIKINIDKTDKEGNYKNEVYALLPCHFDWSSNNIELDKLSDNINIEKKKLHNELILTTDNEEIIEINKKIRKLYFKERLYIKYGDMSQNKKDIYDACIDKECIDKIDKNRFTKIATKLQIAPRLQQYFKDFKDFK